MYALNAPGELMEIKPNPPDNRIGAANRPLDVPIRKS